ncbi:hypothetical protein ATPR_3049 [Acetobacter tropicalis NBRC 101654]|uniref:Uncharacterized protein n=1 Tax=Acetobacter tropicalis NBRC 101654 TaxID=749388 RepID=F7VI50_9PROT|nr:hypothetical protein ATPR_3049 [Acetobacter tropicalis NBRC 101654]
MRYVLKIEYEISRTVLSRCEKDQMRDAGRSKPDVFGRRMRG